MHPNYFRGRAHYPSLAPLGPGVVMGYYDGNTVTALWNYAQYFSMSDNFHGSTFGPSAVGAINLASGMTGNVNLSVDDSYGDLAYDVVNNTIIGDPDPWYEDCVAYDQAGLAGKNIGDLLNAKNISWGWFRADLLLRRRTIPAPMATQLLRRNAHHHQPARWHTGNRIRRLSQSVPVLRQHQQPTSHRASQRRGSWAPRSGEPHLRPEVFLEGSVLRQSAGGQFLESQSRARWPPGNSSPLDEQQWLTDTLNKLQSLQEWNETAVFIASDDSDGWYDHAIGPIINQSATTADALSGPGACGTVQIH